MARSNTEKGYIASCIDASDLVEKGNVGADTRATKGGLGVWPRCVPRWQSCMPLPQPPDYALQPPDYALVYSGAAKR